MENCCSSSKRFSAHPEYHMERETKGTNLGGEAADQAASAVGEIDLNQGISL
jgi:hypothetical protein